MSDVDFNNVQHVLSAQPQVCLNVLKNEPGIVLANMLIHHTISVIFFMYTRTSSP